MSNNWPIFELGKLCEKITDGAHHSPKSVEVGLPMASVKDLSEFGVIATTARQISKIDFEKLVKGGCRPQKGDVLISKDGNSALDTSCVVRHEPNYVLLSSVAIIRPNPKLLNSKFLHCYFRNPLTVKYLKDNFISGAAIPRVVLKDFKRAHISTPGLAVQQKIAECISHFDDKIELNRHMNETLEAMAQAIFKDWFVDFGPVHRKLAGETDPVKILGGLIPDLDKAETIANLFPDSFGDDGLPEGWERKLIGDVCSKIFSGGTPRTKELSYWGGEIPWLSSGETRSSFIIGTEKTITELGVENSSTREAKAGTTVIASAGQGKTRGQTSYLAFDSFINQSVVALQANENMISKSFLYIDLKRRYAEFRAVSDAHSSRGSLTTKLLAGLDVVCPKKEIIEKFDLIVFPMIEKIVSNLSENQTLAETRDYLLPRLMSGEVRVDDMEG